MADPGTNLGTARGFCPPIVVGVDQYVSTAIILVYLPDLPKGTLTMDDDAWSTVEKTLRKRRQDIAQAWYEAISPTADHTEGTTEVRARLETLLDQAVGFLIDKTLGSNMAEAIGGALSALDTPQPDTLGRSLETLTVEILGGLPAEQAVGLQPRLAKLVGGMATGHGRAARESILSQQGSIHSELLGTREGVERALRTSEARFRQLIDLLPVGF